MWGSKKIVVLDSLQVFLELLLLVAEMCRDHDKLLPIEAEESEGLYFGWVGYKQLEMLWRGLVSSTYFLKALVCFFFSGGEWHVIEYGPGLKFVST